MYVERHHTLNGPTIELDYLRSHYVDMNAFYKLFGSSPNIEDPYSDEYKDWELSFFEFLSGKKYDFLNEGAPRFISFVQQFADMTIENKKKCLCFQSDLLDILGDIKDKRILEMGCGSGILANFLESCGSDYFAVDASKIFVEATKKQIRSEVIKSQILQMSFYDISKFQQKFDVVIFEASFHHCGEPLRLLNLLFDNTTTNGKIIFLREPISSGFDRPWGVVRNDGETILQIRRLGWLELGFRLDFFRDILMRTGWVLQGTILLSDGTSAYVANKNCRQNE
jgi:2-polyprenyl-3-methyl-5-hydroxy-6-metoxy-1,4-benzoquinol methylase